MKKHKPEDKMWETPSLEWIHRVRHERQTKRKGQPIVPLAGKEAEKLAKQFGLKLARRTPAER